jgi:hypothetical protein
MRSDLIVHLHARLVAFVGKRKRGGVRCVHVRERLVDVDVGSGHRGLCFCEPHTRTRIHQTASYTLLRIAILAMLLPCCIHYTRRHGIHVPSHRIHPLTLSIRRQNLLVNLTPTVMFPSFARCRCRRGHRHRHGGKGHRDEKRCRYHEC